MPPHYNLDGRLETYLDLGKTIRDEVNSDCSYDGYDTHTRVPFSPRMGRITLEQKYKYEALVARAKKYSNIFYFQRGFQI